MRSIKVIGLTRSLKYTATYIKKDISPTHYVT
jgi:hypothetical protein